MTVTAHAFADSDEFARRVDPFRRELLAHCYRMLGSIHDAEDMLQDTFLRAWRAHDEFDVSRASLRTWLYRIATNACLTALERRRRRLPSGLGDPSHDPEAALELRSEVAWLQPIPDTLIGSQPGDPAAIVASRGSIRLAFIAALQYLPARQRAVLILRDVLAWRAAEVAELLGTSTAAVNSLLQRARAHLEQVAPVENEIAEPGDAGQRALLDQYVTAFQDADVTALMRLLREDAELEMPPYLTWFSGREAVARFLAARTRGIGGIWRTVPTGANGHPAIATYLPGSDGVPHAHAIQVLTITGTGIARIVAFMDPRLFVTFGLPQEQPG
ncbi:MAG TPA: sigma-70 family RNA polymerase sigma factor [Streptosporangiaceae bacterium]|nr:sigma-70 family RNA polymerase sigma factor [Streptosporangiaceae bacterium]